MGSQCFQQRPLRRERWCSVHTVIFHSNSCQQDGVGELWRKSRRFDCALSWKEHPCPTARRPFACTWKERLLSSYLRSSSINSTCYMYDLSTPHAAPALLQTREFHVQQEAFGERLQAVKS